MQDFRLEYDDALPGPFQVFCFDGVRLMVVNSRRLAQLPNWLRAHVVNDALAATVPPGPATAAEDAPEPTADVIDINTRRRAG